MSKFRCVCGETISISGEIPNPCRVVGDLGRGVRLYEHEVHSYVLASIDQLKLAYPTRLAELLADLAVPFEVEYGFVQPVLAR